MMTLLSNDVSCPAPYQPSPGAGHCGVAAMIAVHQAFYRAFKAIDIPSRSDAEERAVVDAHTFLQLEWQREPCRTIEDIRAKVGTILSDRSLLDNLFENDGELEMLLRSIMGERPPLPAWAQIAP